MSTSTPPKLQHVAIETEDGIAIVKYNRPKAGNALNTPTLKDILAGLQWAEQDPNTRIIITTGEGKFYTAGLDLLDPVNQGPDSTISDEFVDVLSQIHKTLINTNKLTIAAVNGPAPGWGTSSLGLHDLVYSTPDAIFFTPFVQWGLCAEGCSSHTFKSIMGRQKASALILAGQRMTPQELDSAGLITKIMGKEEFMESVLDVARGAVKLPPKSLLLNKELMMRGTREELLRVNEVELGVLREQTRGKESKDAIRGFAEAQARKKAQSKAKL
ncbi:hypothetical protein PMZ80_005292 [Knufia obscura]|uniref:Enoyl-CoA hydratase n=2 Tax=Knufia TaxID=430999 RepID=A0AAN8EKM4_9EURO|nr:hypothetical protein PMZ80_005292 [Knufia obscura]KAK5957959.1 hypothetical protein OHC33_001149 [Knufia fluminis]